MASLRSVLPACRRVLVAGIHARATFLLPRALRGLSSSGAQPPDSPEPSTAHLILEREQEIAAMQADLRAAISAGRWATAASISEKCLEATEALFTKNHVAYAAALNNRGLVLKSSGRIQDALECYQDAFKTYSQLVGQDHASTAAALSNLGLCHLAIADKASGMAKLEAVNIARRCFEDAQTARMAALGSDHWLTASTAVHLASALRIGRQFGEAERVLVAAVAQLRSSVGTRHAATASALNNLGLLYKQMGELERAGDAYTEAWALRKGLLGDAHPDTISTHYNIAELMRARGDEEGAVKLQAQIVALLEGSGGSGGSAGETPAPSSVA